MSETSEPVCEQGGCGERAYCNEAGECLVKVSEADA